MSSLINKIEEKLSSSSSRDDEPNRVQRPNPEQSDYDRDTTNFSSLRAGDNTSGGSHYGQHPTSGADGRPIGSGIDGYGSNHTTSTSQHSNQPSTLTGDVNRRIPGSWDTTDRTTGTSNLTQESSTYGGAPYEPKGQQTAASVVTRDTDVNHAQGVTNTAGNPRVQSTGIARGTESVTGDRYAAGQSSSDHHYGRDAGIVGGTGAAGLGAYEAGKYSGASPNTHHESAGPNETSLSKDQEYGTRSNLSNVSYMNRDNTNGQHHSNSRPFQHESSGGRGTGVPDPNPHAISDRALARKMGAAYEAGYRDALEHLRAEYNQDNLGRNGTSRNSNTAANSAYSEDYGAKEKPSIAEKLNPKKDADRDGKAGIMS